MDPLKPRVLNKSDPHPPEVSAIVSIIDAVSRAISTLDAERTASGLPSLSNGQIVTAISNVLNNHLLVSCALDTISSDKPYTRDSILKIGNHVHQTLRSMMEAAVEEEASTKAVLSRLRLHLQPAGGRA